nr:MAG TPA_asm: hypothetical protein [Caudoviricetes sp.]
MAKIGKSIDRAKNNAIRAIFPQNDYNSEGIKCLRK